MSDYVNCPITVTVDLASTTNETTNKFINIHPAYVKAIKMIYYNNSAQIASIIAKVIDRKNFLIKPVLVDFTRSKRIIQVGYSEHT